MSNTSKLTYPAPIKDLLPWASPSAMTAVFGFLAALLALYTFPALFRSKSRIHDLGGFSLLTAWPFFTKRYDFLQRNFKKTRQDLFQFKVLQHRVVAVSGEDGRRVFFNDKNLNFTEGYKILMGGAPRLEDISIVKDDDPQAPSFNKRLQALLHKDRLGDMLPILFDDINERMKGWGNVGKINPFKDVYDLVFQMTVRMATCRELAQDQAEVKRLSELYWSLEKSATPVALLLPWLPSPSKKQNERATRDLYMMLLGYVDKRRKADVPSPDAIDALIAEGSDDATIIGFILGVIFAGVINTGINSCWVLLFLAANPEWKKKVADEVNSLIASHTNTTSSDPLHKRLASIPVSAWEDEMPVVELCIRETLRIIQTGTTLRRNVTDGVHVGDKHIDNGAFMAYSLADVHLNPDIYPEPYKFDPDRYSVGREEDKKGTFSFLGWGAGRHPCTGMKVAKLEMKMILALFLAGYEYELVNASGEFPDPFPQPDRNDIQQVL